MLMVGLMLMVGGLGSPMMLMVGCLESPLMLIVGIPLTLMFRGPLMLMVQGLQGRNQRATSWNWLLKHHVSCSWIVCLLKMQMQKTHCHHHHVLQSQSPLTYDVKYDAPKIPISRIAALCAGSCGLSLVLHSWIHLRVSCRQPCARPHTVCESSSNVYLAFHLWRNWSTGRPYYT